MVRMLVSYIHCKKVHLDKAYKQLPEQFLCLVRVIDTVYGSVAGSTQGHFELGCFIADERQYTCQEAGLGPRVNSLLLDVVWGKL